MVVVVMVIIDRGCCDLTGHWDFEQRLRASVESESQSLAQGRASKKESRTRLASSSAPQRPSSATGPSAVKVRTRAQHHVAL